jgi:sigma-54 dependent transcriptional regulator, acetoin dehydrogenase operon transcriptional activator AcoR
MCEDNTITQLHLPPIFLIENTGGTRKTLVELVQDAEKQIILNALKIEGNTVEGKKKVADQLGISLATLYNKIKGLGVRS